MIQGFSGYLSYSLKLACFIAFHFCDSESIIQFVLFITLTAYQSLLTLLDVILHKNVLLFPKSKTFFDWRSTFSNNLTFFHLVQSYNFASHEALHCRNMHCIFDYNILPITCGDDVMPRDVRSNMIELHGEL